MGRARDISDFLGKTEVSNTTNDALLTADTELGGLSTAQAENIRDNASLAYYSTLDSLPQSGLTEGDRAFVESSGTGARLYISNGTGWYNVALVNLSPSMSLTPSGAIALNNDGVTTSTVTIVATDSDNPDTILSYSVESDGNGIGKYVLSQDSSVFTIRALSEDSGATAGSFTLTFKTTDNINISTENKNFSLSYFPSPVIGRWSARYSGYSGSGTDLPNLGTADSADGTLQSGVSYDGSNEWFDFDATGNAYVQYPEENGQYPDSDFTIYAIVNINAYGNASERDGYLENTLFTLNGANSSIASRRGGIRTALVNGYPYVGFGDTSSVWNELQSSTQLSLNTWYMLAFTRNRATGAVAIYIDDMDTPSDTATKSTDLVKHSGFGYEIATGTTFGKIHITIYTYYYGFKGKAVDWGIYDNVISSTDLNTIKNLYASDLSIS